MGALNQRAIARMEAGVVRLVDGLLDKMQEHARVDFVDDFAAPTSGESSRWPASAAIRWMRRWKVSTSNWTSRPPQREQRAAAALARRRRLGPYRAAEDRKDHRLRDLAAMARAGFAYDVAKKVIDAKDPDFWTKPEHGSMVGA